MEAQKAVAPNCSEKTHRWECERLSRFEKSTANPAQICAPILIFLQGESEVDVIAEQLKFRACLKILMTELRTLATGFEVDGGKLRFQLYSWLEKEIAAMHKICNYKVNGNVLRM